MYLLNYRLVFINTLCVVLFIFGLSNKSLGQNEDVCLNTTKMYYCDACTDFQSFTWYPPPSDVCTAVPMGTSILITWKKSGTYDINVAWTTSTGSNQSGVFKTVTVHDATTISVSASPSEAAPGESILLSASGASSYTWSGPELVTSSGSSVYANFPYNASEATYSASGSTSSGCGSSGSVTVLLGVSAGPDRTACKDDEPLDLSTFGPELTEESWSGPSGSIDDGFIILSQLAIGDHVFTYTRTSDGNSDSMVLTVSETVAGSIEIIPSLNCDNVSGTLRLDNYSGNILRWERSIDSGLNWYSVESSGGKSSINFSEAQEMYYRAIVQYSGCSQETSDAISVAPVKPVGGVVSPSTIQIDCGQAIGDLRLDNYVGDLLQWEYSYDEVNWSSVLEETEEIYSVDVTENIFYRVRVEQSTANCDPEFSSTYKIEVNSVGGNAYTSVTTQCVTADGEIYLENYIGSVTTWEYSVNASDWTPITGSEGQMPLVFSSSEPMNYYRAAVQLDDCIIDYSSIVSIEVSSPTQPGVVRLDSQPIYDYQDGDLRFYATFRLDNYLGQIEQWQKETSNGVTYENETTQYFSTYIHETTSVRSEVKNGGCEALLSGQAIFVVNDAYLGVQQIVDGLSLDDYRGYSYQIQGADGVELKNGFSFFANAAQDFFVLLDDNYSLPQAENYIVEETALVSGLTESNLYFANAEQKQSTHTYFDDLGKVKQQVERRGSPNKKDIVVPITYDIVGRQDKSYLPYESNESNGYFKSNGLSEQTDFYLTPPEKVATSSYAYAQTIFENSTLNRVLEQGAPGADWQPGSGHTIRYDYQINDFEEVKLWRIDSDTQLPVSDTYYEPGDLHVNVNIDEHGSRVKEYEDKEGSLVLKRVQLESEWLDTYYIYDKLNLLRYVIQPEGVANLSENPDMDFLDSWAFEYRYDGRNRLIVKKVPGAGPVYMVYDDRNRLVLTQDGNQRLNHEWVFTKYDALNRPVSTGVYRDAVNLSRESVEQKVINFYTNLATNGGAWFESMISSVNGNVHGYNNASFPSIDDESKYLTVTYYDNYRFQHAAFYGFIHEVGNVSNINKVKGQVTGSKTKILDTDQFIHSAFYFDSRYRLIQSQSDNQLGGVDVVFNKYDFAGRILESKTRHSTAAGGLTNVSNSNIYDHSGRLLSTYHQIDNEAAVQLSLYSYNAIGELIEKNLHSNNEGAYLQSIDYRYNIRGWLTHINNAALENDEGVTNNDANDWFGMELAYNVPFIDFGSGSNYNGNISATKWNASTGTVGYKYSYDAINRLTDADYRELLAVTNTNAYDIQVSGYDRNGNIQSLSRNTNNGTEIDDLTYDYVGNQLQLVTDNAPVATKDKGFKDGNASGNDYVYDDNGNMTVDLNKEIIAIEYNHLNLPEKVTKADGQYIKYSYDATGIKLSQKVYDGVNTDPIKETDYVGEFIYEDDALAIIQHEEGRIVPNTDGWEYNYHLKDHLGNTRVTFTTEPKTVGFTLNYESSTVDVDDEASFDNLNNIINADIHDYVHPDETVSHTKSQLLHGGNNGVIGSVLTIPVGKDDQIDASVYAKYLAPTGTTNPTAAVSSLVLAAITGSTGTSSYEGAINSNVGTDGSLINGLGTGTVSSTEPMAFINLLFLPEDVADVDGLALSYAQVSSASSNNHAILSLPETFTAPKNGHVVIYLSNESALQTNVYFDDLSITVTESKIIQADSYYPFGLQFNQWSRATNKENKYLYNGKELQTELDLDWLDYGARMYQPEIGRWNGVDKKSDAYSAYSPYNFVLGNPIANTDVNGEWTVSRHHSMTINSLSVAGIGGKQAELIAHYASMYADNPGEHLKWNNIAHPTNKLYYRSDIDYTGTVNSQITGWGGSYNYNIWHSMRSSHEKDLFDSGHGGISARGAMLRGLNFGWSKVFESAKSGKLGNLKRNSKGIQQFGQGLHALQDAYAHKGRHDVGAGHLVNDRLGDTSQAEGITTSAVMVHSIMSGDADTFNTMVGEGNTSLDLDGISGKNLLELNDKISENGGQLRYNWETKKYDINQK